jgi:hypothetical protein
MMKRLTTTHTHKLYQTYSLDFELSLRNLRFFFTEVHFWSNSWLQVASLIRPTWPSIPDFSHPLLWILWYWIKRGDQRVRPRINHSCFMVWVSKYFWRLAFLILVAFFSLGQILRYYLQHAFLFIFESVPSFDAMKEPNSKSVIKYREECDSKRITFHVFSNPSFAVTLPFEATVTLPSRQSVQIRVNISFFGLHETRELIFL